MAVLSKFTLIAVILSCYTITVTASPPSHYASLVRREDDPAIVADVAPFPYESITLDPAEVGTEYPELLPAADPVVEEKKLKRRGSRSKRSSLVRGINQRTIFGRAQKKCKLIPGDNDWPKQGLWDALEQNTTGEVLKEPTPLAAVCYAGPLYNEADCSRVTNNWADPDLHDEHATSIMSPFHQGATCVPTSNPNQGTCSTFGFPNYVVKAKSVQDVQLAVNFARSTNVRLVIKNTGHDFSGKSAGANSLSVWTHFFKDIEYIANYNGADYNGPAFKVGAGVQGSEIYKAAAEKGLMVVAGEGMTVGFAGGYIQGGGHSPLSSILGIAADHVLSFQIVTADGQFRFCNATTNPDLFWAVRGGGGSTYGVMTSVVVKAYPTVPATTVKFTFTTSDTVTIDQWWDAVKAYLSTFPAMADAGVYSYFLMPTPGVFDMNPGIFAPKLSAAQVENLLAPLYNKLKEHGIPITPTVRQHSNFYDAWQHGFPKEAVGGWTSQAGSRLFPRANWETTASFDAMFNAIKSTITKGHVFLGFNLGPTLAKGGNPENAVNTAWRNTLFHAIALAPWPLGSSAEYIEEVRQNFTNIEMKRWRDVSPGGGSYLGESDVNEPDFQTAFWGQSKYSRLYELKQKYDPCGVFFARTAVGSEDWEITPPEQRLCPIDV